MVEWLEKIGYMLDSENEEITELLEPKQCAFFTMENQQKIQCTNQTRYAVQGTSEYAKKYEGNRPLCQHHLIEDGLAHYYIDKIRLPPKVYPNRVWIAIEYADFERLYHEAGLKGNGTNIHRFWKILNDMAVEKAWDTF